MTRDEIIQTEPPDDTPEPVIEFEPVDCIVHRWRVVGHERTRQRCLDCKLDRAIPRGHVCVWRGHPEGSRRWEYCYGCGDEREKCCAERPWQLLDFENRGA